MGPDADRLNWSLEHGAVGDYADDVFTDLAEACRQICDEHFPDEAGYDVSRTRISGPLEGVNLLIERTGFRALISVQRYQRLRGLARDGRCAHEIRVVAAARRTCSALVPHPYKLELRGRVIGYTVGALGLTVGALAAAGLLSTWSQAVLLLPILLGLRMYWAGRIAQSLRRNTTPSPALPAPQAAPERSSSGDDGRWTAALAELERQREALAERFTLRPFRTIPTGPALPASASERDPPLRSAG